MELADQLGAETVAEGIETADALEVLRAMGCPRGQGFFFARPVEVDDLAECLASLHALPLVSEGALT